MKLAQGDEPRKDAASSGEASGMIEKFKDKVCVVTGAGSGIGRALAVKLAGAGAALAISDINPEGLEETAQMIGKGSNRIRKDVLDVSDAAAIEPYAAAVKESLGSADYVFNVAGLARIGTFKDTPLDSFEKVMNVNFWGVVRMTKAFLPQLIETKGGVVNISSLFGLIGLPTQSSYCASKFAVREKRNANSPRLTNVSSFSSQARSSLPRKSRDKSWNGSPVARIVAQRRAMKSID